MFSQGLRAIGGNACRMTCVALRSAPELQTTANRLGGMLSNGSASALSIIQLRYFNSVKYSSKMEYYSASDHIKLPRKLQELEHALEGHDRPLTLLLTWLMAKDRHIRKYVKFYNDLGIDVLNIKFSPLDIMSPGVHGQRVVEQFLHFVHHYPETCPLLIHGFSVGGYLCATAMHEVEKDFEKHGHLLDRFVGQIWDSVVDVAGTPIGVARSVTDSKPLQDVIQKSIEWYLRYRYDSVTVFYERASVQFHKNYMGTPGLFFASEADPISPPSMVFKAHDIWKSLGFPVYKKCWDDTKHVTHRMKHPEEYEKLVLTFLKSLGLSLRPSVLPVKKIQERKIQAERKPQPHPAPILTLSR